MPEPIVLVPGVPGSPWMSQLDVPWGVEWLRRADTPTDHYRVLGFSECGLWIVTGTIKWSQLLAWEHTTAAGRLNRFGWVRCLCTKKGT